MPPTHRPEPELGNALNQYSAQGTARGLEVTGLALEEAEVSVAVDGGTAQAVDRASAAGQAAEAGSFRTVIPLEGAQMEGRWLRVAVNTTAEPGADGTAQRREGWLFAPPAAFSPVHDLDGNLVEDARWDYTWDAEPSRGTEVRWTDGAAYCPAGVRAQAERPNQNRLVGMQEKVIPVAAGLDPTTAPKQLKLEFAYDAQHRRVMKRVKEWAGDAVTGGFTNVVKDRRYVYDPEFRS